MMLSRPMPTPLYPQAVLDLLKGHGARVGSLVTCIMNNDERWRGWVLAPHLLSPLASGAPHAPSREPSQEAFFPDAAPKELAPTAPDRAGPHLFLLTEDGLGVGLAIADIAQITEHGHRTEDTTAPPPRWDLARQMLAKGPHEAAQGPRQRSLFSRLEAPAELPEAVCIIECGSLIERFVSPPGPSSTWQEAVDAALGTWGPLVYATAYRDEPHEQRWGAKGLVAQLLQNKLTSHTRGIVLLHDGTAPLVESLSAWRHKPLPCPLLLLSCDDHVSDRHQRLDALQAAIYAARYIDIGECLRCALLPSEEVPRSPRQAHAEQHKGRAPLGSYQFNRLFSEGEAQVATLHRGALMLQTLRAWPLDRAHRSSESPGAVKETGRYGR